MNGPNYKKYHSELINILSFIRAVKVYTFAHLVAVNCVARGKKHQQIWMKAEYLVR